MIFEGENGGENSEGEESEKNIQCLLVAVLAGVGRVFVMDK